MYRKKRGMKVITGALNIIIIFTVPNVVIIVMLNSIGYV